MQYPTIANEQWPEGLLEGLRAALTRLPGAPQSELTKSAIAQDRGWDALVRLNLGNRPVVLLVEIKKRIYPRDAREVMWRYRARAPVGVEPGETWVPLIASESLSETVRELLRAENIGYFDSSGSLFIPLDGPYVFVDRPPPRKRRYGLPAVFEGKSTRIVHELLEHRDEWYSAAALANACSVVPSTASRTLMELERLDFVETRGKGPSKERKASNATKLLDAWAEVVRTSPPPVDRYFVPGVSADSGTLLERLAEAMKRRNVAYAVTHEAAAQLYSPFLSAIKATRIRAVPGAPLDEALAELNAKIVTEGANLEIIPVSSRYDLFRGIENRGVVVASAVQTYLDLQRVEGRAKEMAAHLRSEVLQF